MFQLPGKPSYQAEVHELADFMEFQAWTNGFVSKRDVQALLGRLDDNDDNEGCDDDDDATSDHLDETIIEIERRLGSCRASYPFSIDKTGNVISYTSSNSSPGADVYKYLLLSTRLNMKSNRMHNGIDGTHILEEWSALAIRNYLGKDRARSFVFGTSNQGLSFADKVNAIHHQTKDGGPFRNIDPVPTDANDGKLDVVAWIPFQDQLAGQVVIFAQCKTGQNWRDKVSELQPSSFISKWMVGSVFVVTPQRAFCVSESVNRGRWKSLGIDSGILFDRCRLIDCIDSIDNDLLERTKRWTTAAVQSAVSQ